MSNYILNHSGSEVDTLLNAVIGVTAVATTTTNGLMSAADKMFLTRLYPNVSVTASDLFIQEVVITNAKEENLVDLVGVAEPRILAQVRTDNLLNVNDENNFNSYISSNGAISNGANDIVGPFMAVSPGDDIYYTGTVGPTDTQNINRRLHVYDSNQQWIKQISYSGGLASGQSWSTHGVVPSNGAYVRVSWGTTDSNVMVSVGAPEKYMPYYITPFGEVTSFQFGVADNAQHTDATVYTVNLPLRDKVYAFVCDPIEGTLDITAGHIDSYNGETLPGFWWSDRDTYEAGTSPSIGAEVVYVLNEEDYISYEITPMTIPLYYHDNYIYAVNGTISGYSYYAETVSLQHVTINNGVTMNGINMNGSDITNWNNALETLAGKADLNSPSFTGNMTVPGVGSTTNSNRPATTTFVQDKMNNIAPNETGATSKNPYSVGDLLCLKGTLCKATDAIAIGDTITIGTNVTQTTVAAELQALATAIANIQT